MSSLLPQNSLTFLVNVYNSWLSKDGLLVLGLDFYKENTISHSWPEDCGVSIMHLFLREIGLTYSTRLDSEKLSQLGLVSKKTGREH